MHLFRRLGAHGSLNGARKAEGTVRMRVPYLSSLSSPHSSGACGRQRPPAPFKAGLERTKKRAMPVICDFFFGLFVLNLLFKVYPRFIFLKAPTELIVLLFSSHLVSFSQFVRIWSPSFLSLTKELALFGGWLCFLSPPFL